MSEEQSTGTERQEPDVANERLRQELIGELKALVKRLQAISPDYAPPPFSSRRMFAFVQDSLKRFAPEMRLPIVKQLREALSGDLLDLETWKGLWFLINYSLKYQADMIKRRFTGDYETDAWGLDWEFLETVIPFVNFLYEIYWRVETTGIERIPHTGRALLVSNHSGQLPWDGVMIGAAVWNEHPSQRLVRSLFNPWFSQLPFLSAMFVKLGQAVATVENGTRLLEQDELVAVFPEGYEGVSKLYSKRYQLARFGRGEFVKMALNTQAPIIPVAVVGAEETYITLAKSPTLARLTGLPYFSITMRFPWLGLLGLVPLPTKWYIDFGQPIETTDYGSGAAMDLMLMTQLKNQVRDAVQGMINARLADRQGVFF